MRRRANHELDGDERVAAERIIVALLVVLRAGTLALGTGETLGPSSHAHRAMALVVLAALAGQTALVFGTASSRLRRGAMPVFDSRMALSETLAAGAALIAVAYATKPDSRATSAFWVEPYTVVSALVLAAAASRLRVGAGATTAVAAFYLLSVLVVAQDGDRLSSADRATAWTNALSYLPFFAIGALGFTLLRAVVAQTEALRRLLARLAAERARVAAASRAYRTGHDLPKAVLREVRRNVMPAQTLRPWAAGYRDELLLVVSGETRPSADAHEELRALANVFGTALDGRVHLDALGEMPPGAPTLLIVEATRELLNNATYHAFGYPVALSARSTRARVDVTVHDGGLGVDPRVLASAWARKQNSVHQLEAAGGSYRITSAPDAAGGTTVTLTWPSRGTTAPGSA
jgi:hypothetical protein